MAVKFGSILHLNNSGSEATLDSNNLRGTTIEIDTFNSASLAEIGSGLSTAPGKRRLGTIVSTTGSLTPIEYYVYTQRPLAPIWGKSKPAVCPTKGLERP